FLAYVSLLRLLHSVFYINDSAATDFYTLSLHDALPISWKGYAALADAITGRTSASVVREQWQRDSARYERGALRMRFSDNHDERDRKSTRLNSSHLGISYAVFCLKKKKYYTLTDMFYV